jgi:predicted transcriptional regulator
MRYEFPPKLDELVKEQMASGQYASEDQLLVEALLNLAEYKRCIADVREGIEDERAGRMQSVEEVDAELRKKYDIAQDA